MWESLRRASVLAFSGLIAVSCSSDPAAPANADAQPRTSQAATESPNVVPDSTPSLTTTPLARAAPATVAPTTIPPTSTSTPTPTLTPRPTATEAPPTRRPATATRVPPTLSRPTATPTTPAISGRLLTLGMLDGHATLVASDGTYLGLISSNRFPADSICSSFGRYGSAFSSTSIRNQFSLWERVLCERAPTIDSRVRRQKSSMRARRSGT